VFRQLFTRFLLPQLLLIMLPAAFAVILALVEVKYELAWFLGSCLVAGVGSVIAMMHFFKTHLNETADMLTEAVPAARPKYADYDVLKDVAHSFSELMDEAVSREAQLMTVISSMSDGLIATDHQQRILLTNDAAEELLTFRMKASRGRQLWEVVPIEGVLKAVTEVSLTGQHKTVSVGPVAGKHLEVTVTRLPLRPAGFIIVAHDVTETMRYEELRKEFVANVSHELRTPLTVIKGYVETLADGAIDDRARAMQYLSTVAKHTEHLTNLVNDLLNLSRLDSTAAIPSPRPVHLGRVASKISELMTPAAAKKGHKLITHIADGLRPVIGNPEYLERAVANLVDNAIKYTKEDGLVKLIVRGEGDEVIVEVIDNGIGIPEEELPRIFERFYRVERSRARDMGGTGLGLSIVKHIVQAHAGTVEVESTPGSGTTFRMRLPAALEQDAGEQSGTSGPSA
jgi:two-component system phosphate regulon sensor histidine kinase PhoR